ncbi:MAG: hypothetical protein GH150_06685 [Hadesarchaea archaeon]|nr:hypothetical protein [Hadesarchaea archaeon]
MSHIQVTLTPAESKRLIAKAVAALPEVKRALRQGTIVIGLGTTNARVAEELLGKKIEREKFVAGAVLPKGTCVVPRERRRGDIIIRGGKLIESKLNDVLLKLTAGDVFIKGANALDASGAAGVLLASRQGGTVGSVLGTLMARGVNFIIPVGLEKFIPGSIQRVSKTTGIFRASYATGCARSGESYHRTRSFRDSDWCGSYYHGQGRHLRRRGERHHVRSGNSETTQQSPKAGKWDKG